MDFESRPGEEHLASSTASSGCQWSASEEYRADGEKMPSGSGKLRELNSMFFLNFVFRPCLLSTTLVEGFGFETLIIHGKENISEHKRLQTLSFSMNCTATILCSMF